MSDELVLFLDFDDTVSDAKRHGHQYVAELGYILARDFGGEPDDWIPAVGLELSCLMDRYTEEWSYKPVTGFTEWVKRERVAAADSVLAAVGKQFTPEDYPQRSHYFSNVQFDALTGTNAVFAGVYESLSQLAVRGIRMNMASSQESEYLRASLIGAGIEQFIEMKFGPDLIDCPKEGTEYYLRLFDECKISPRQAIVIDDQPQCLDWAEEVGARVIQATLIDEGKAPEFPIVLTRWNDLLQLLNPYLR